MHKDSGIKNVTEFVAAAKAKGSDWIMAGTGKGQEDQLLTNFLNKAYGLKMKYVPYKGGGRVAKELAGKHANSTVNNPSEQLGFYEAGRTRPLAAFTPTRLPLFKDAPTFKELGKEFVYFMQRSVVGAPGMSKEAETFYRSVFAQVYASDEWQNYMEKKSLQGGFLTGKTLKRYWGKEKNIHRTMLKEIRGDQIIGLQCWTSNRKGEDHHHAMGGADHGRNYGDLLPLPDVEERRTPHRLASRGGPRRWGVPLLVIHGHAHLLALGHPPLDQKIKPTLSFHRTLQGRSKDSSCS